MKIQAHMKTSIIIVVVSFQCARCASWFEISGDMKRKIADDIASDPIKSSALKPKDETKHAEAKSLQQPSRKITQRASQLAGRAPANSKDMETKDASRR